MEKKKIKFNVVDAIVVVALVAVLAFASVKLFGGIIGGGDSDNSKADVTYKITFFTEESTWYSLENLKMGDSVTDDTTGVDVGKVTELDLIPESCAQLPADDGTYKVAPRPGYGSGTITFECDGEKDKHGAKIKYSVFSEGQTVTLRVGKSKVYGRIKDVETISESSTEAAPAGK